VLIAGLGAKAAIAAEAASTKSCADQVIADWYDDGKVSKIYPLHCYREAIKKLPPDVRDYSNAREEIARALAFAAQGKQDPGGSATTTATASTGTQDTTSEKTTTTKTTETKTTNTSTTPTIDTSTIDTSTIDTTTPDTSGPSSLPIPLLVLGGLAVLLLAAGSAGYLRRRMNNGDDGDGTPPPTPPVA